MRLIQFHVKEYKSIWNSNECGVADITCLVGKNEAGKTALLEALYKLNPISLKDSSYDLVEEYPRSEVGDYEDEVESGNRSPATVVEATYRLEDTELEAINRDFGEEALDSHDFTRSKRYDNQTFFDVSTNEENITKFLIADAELSTDDANALAKCTTLQATYDVLEGFEEPNQAATSLKDKLAEIIKEGLGEHIYNTYLYPFVPKFLYFDEYYQMTGAENIPALKKRKSNETLKDSDHPLLGLLELARLDLDNVIASTRTQEVKNKSEATGNRLSKKVLKYWTQNRHLLTRFDVREGRAEDPEGMREGLNIYAEIYNTRHMATTNIGKRSRGFVWFFSFLAWYEQIKRSSQNVILLLDEPGLTLHGTAQADLLRFFDEEIEHQLIYTTHSPFLVDPRRFDRARIVQDKGIDTLDPLPREEDGTKVLTDVLEASPDSLFPLQGALGYELYQTLFVGPNCLVVEGISDLMYLNLMTMLLEAEGREGLSPEWTVTPVGGSDKVPTFVALLGAQQSLNVATLIDFQKKDKQMIENLYKKRLLEKQKVLTYADFAAGNEADVEDMFDEAFYLELVNGEFKGSLQKKVTKTALKSKHPRVVKRLEAHFTANPLNSGTRYNHYRPAHYFSANIGVLSDKVTSETLDRFEAMFKALNALL